MLGYFIVVSVLGIILYVVEKNLCLNGSALKVAPTAFNGLQTRLALQLPPPSPGPNPLHSHGA